MRKVLAPLLRVRIEHVAPAAHFRDDHVTGGEFLNDGLDSVRIARFHLGGVSGPVPQPAMLLGNLRGVIRFEKNGAAQSQGPGTRNIWHGPERRVRHGQGRHRSCLAKKGASR